ncbi:hypothetical protein [Desulfurobacterium sp.]|nr:hypothetical protein [Desulfurobacterium sp.]
MIVTANELKRRGISYISELLKKFENVFISVRGKKVRNTNRGRIRKAKRT